MFDSTIPLALEPLEGDDGQIINYVNALPGAGKTWTFDHQIALPHVKHKHNSLLVYAAPTSKLLQERERSLLDLGISKDKIMVILSEDLPAGTTVANAFRDAVIGRKGQKGMPNGTIILCTHECVARIPTSMKGRDRIVLVYDEARACLQDNYALHLPEDVYQYLTEPQDHFAEDGRKIVQQRMLSPRSVYESPTGNTSESVYIWQWNNPRIPLPRIERLQEFLPRGSRQRAKANGILDFLRNIHSSSLDVYVSVTRKKETNEYVISNVFSPSRMFKGYAKVLILSAFFESSQMYQFLAQSSQVDDTVVHLQDVTTGHINKKRMTRLLKRMRKTRITYVYDLGDKKTLTKREMQQGVVMQKPLSKEQRKNAHAKWHELYPSKPELYRTVFDAYRDLDGRASRLTDGARARAYDFMARLDSQFGIIGGVIPHMVDISIKLQQEFMARLKLPPETLPVGINPRYNSYKESEAKIWDVERLGDFNKRTKLYRKPKDGDIITQLPITAHGLNAFKDYHSCAFLAAMKYSTREHRFMQRVLPEYNPSIDRTLDYALQLLWRCNVRMPDDSPVLLIVTDRYLAETLQRRFRILAKSWLGKDDTEILPIVAPSRILKGYECPSILLYEYDDTDSQKRRNEARKESAKGKESAELKKRYLQTEEGAAYNRLTTSISYAKRNNKDYAKLEKQRKQLMTFAQWKASPEGIEAYKELTRPTFNAVAAARDALGRLNASKLKGRDEVLKIVSVIKREAPELKAELKRWYPGDKFEHNWKTAEDYGKRYNLGWLFKQTQLYPN